MRQIDISNAAVQPLLSDPDSRRLTSWLSEIVAQLRPNAPQRDDNGAIRTGNRGSLVLYPDGGWFDFEADRGGHGALSFLKYELGNISKVRSVAAEWLSRPGSGRFVPEAISEEAARARAELYAQRAREALRDMQPAEQWSATAPPVSMLNLMARGLSGPYPEKLLGHLDNARLGETALVAILTGLDGTPLGVQLGYLTLSNGEKSTRTPQRCIFYITLDYEERKSALFRIRARPRAVGEDAFPDTTLIVEGAEKAVAVSMAFPFLPVIGLPGIGRLRRIPPVEGATIIVCDGDDPGSRAAKSLRRGIDHLLLTGTRSVHVTATPRGMDADKIVKESGIEALRELIRTADIAELSAAGWAEKLAGIDDPLERDEIRGEALKALKPKGTRARTLDADVDRRRAAAADTGEDQYIVAVPPAIAALWRDPWPEPVDDIGAVLDAASREIRSYVIVSKAAADIVAVWCLFTHFIHHWSIRIQIAARLEIGAVSPECGKTTLLTMTMFLVARPLPAASLTPATVYRTLDKYKPTLILDEVDAQLRSKSNPELNAVLRAFHNRLFAIIPRNVRTAKDNWDITLLSGWGSYAYTTTGRIEDDALESRSIKVKLKRGTFQELDILPEIVNGVLPVLQDCGQMFARWALDQLDLPTTVAIPKQIAARDRNNWRPLFQICKRIGGEWPDRLKAAALEVNGVSRAIGDVVPLLTDILEVFGQAESKTLDELVNGLIYLPEPSADWSTINGGRSINRYWLSHKLNELIVRPENERGKQRIWREGKDIKRGYKKAWFKDSFERYLSADLLNPGEQPPDSGDGLAASAEYVSSPPASKTGPKPVTPVTTSHIVLNNSTDFVTEGLRTNPQQPVTGSQQPVTAPQQPSSNPTDVAGSEDVLRAVAGLKIEPVTKNTSNINDVTGVAGSGSKNEAPSRDDTLATRPPAPPAQPGIESELWLPARRALHTGRNP